MAFMASGCRYIAYVDRAITRIFRLSCQRVR